MGRYPSYRGPIRFRFGVLNSKGISHCPDLSPENVLWMTLCNNDYFIKDVSEGSERFNGKGIELGEGGHTWQA